MDIAELLKKNEISDPVKNFTSELFAVYQAANPLMKIADSIGKMFGFENSKSKLLTKQTAEIGLLLLNALPSLKAEKNYWVIIENIEIKDER